MGSYQNRNQFQKTHLMRIFSLVSIVYGLVSMAGCQTTGTGGNVGHVSTYFLAVGDTAWIRNGEPITFEGEQWYPADGVESFLDSEMYYVGEHRGVPFFVDKVDVRPFDRLYTKFDRNKFRFFEKRKNE